LQKRDQLHREYLGLMRSELQRNLREIAKFPPPQVYYMQYLMRISRELFIQAKDGAIFELKDTRNKPQRTVHVDVRVGDHDFDQTGEDGHDPSVFNTLLPGNAHCPRELNPRILQSMFWRQTDWRYRVAVAQYHSKRNLRQNMPKILDRAGDFTREPPTQKIEPLLPEIDLDVAHWKSLLAQVSGMARQDIRIIDTKAQLRAWEEIVLGIAQDGSEVRFVRQGYQWQISINYLGHNNEYISGQDKGYARTPEQLPSKNQLQTMFKALWQKLQRQVDYAEGEPSDGPVIVDPKIAGDIIKEILMSNLETNRLLQQHDPRTFANHIDKPVIPTFLTIIDDPLMQEFGGMHLSGHYTYDDEWIAARRLVMVEHGILKHFYMSRKPYKQYKQSNGHGRNVFSYPAFSRSGVILVQSKQTLTSDQLTASLIAEARKQGASHGYILKHNTETGAVNDNTYSVTPETIYRVDAKTGKFTPVKGLEVNTSALPIIQGIIATGSDYSAFNDVDGEGPNSVSISVIAPSLLINSMTLRRTHPTLKKHFELPAPNVHK
jgi:predicted Zn-dependent protease